MEPIKITRTPPSQVNAEDQKNSFNRILGSQSSFIKNASSLSKMTESINQVFHNSEVTYIDRDQIYPNPLNRPYMKNITDADFDALKNSIIDTTLLHNLVVIQDKCNRYRLISGEKRWTAISRMTEDEYKTSFPNGIICKVCAHFDDIDEIDEHILLLTANVFTYSNGAPDRKQLKDLIKLYIKKGYGQKDIALFLEEKLKISWQSGYKLFSEATAIPELVDLTDEDKLTSTGLQELATLKDFEQQKALELINSDYGDIKIDKNIALEIKRTIKQSLKKTATNDSASVKTQSYAQFSKNLKAVDKNIEKNESIKSNLMSQVEKEAAQATISTLILRLEKMKEKLSEN